MSYHGNGYNMPWIGHIIIELTAMILIPGATCTVNNM